MFEVYGMNHSINKFLHDTTTWCTYCRRRNRFLSKKNSSIYEMLYELEKKSNVSGKSVRISTNCCKSVQNPKSVRTDFSPGKWPKISTVLLKSVRLVSLGLSLNLTDVEKNVSCMLNRMKCRKRTTLLCIVHRGNLYSHMCAHCTQYTYNWPYGTVNCQQKGGIIDK